MPIQADGFFQEATHRIQQSDVRKVLLLRSLYVIMLFSSLNKSRFRTSRFLLFFTTCLFLSLFTLAQVTLTHRMLNGYFLSNEAPINKNKPTLFVFEQADTFGKVFQPATTMSTKPAVPNFNKEMVIGITLPPTNKPPRLSVSKVFVQDSVLTVRYIRLADTTLTKNPQSFTSQPMLLLSIPKQSVLKTKLVENGKVVETIKKAATD